MESIYLSQIDFRQHLFLTQSREQKLHFIRAEETIFVPEKSPQNIYFSLQGVVKLCKIYQTGKKNLIALLPKQSFLGLSSLRSDKLAREYHAVAFTPVTLISMPIFQFRQELQKSPELSTLFTQRLLWQLLTAEMTIESRSKKTIEAQLVSFLLILGRDFGVKTDSGLKIELRLSCTILGDLLDVSPVSVSKILAQLKQQQIISFQQEKITLITPVR